jgi:ribosomal protein S18 acetylase RimI-like enzyme
MGIRIEVLQECHTTQMQYLARCMMQEGKFASQQADDAIIQQTVKGFVEDNGQASRCFVAVLDDAEIVGFIALQLETYAFRPGLAARDLAFFVMPEWRGTFAAAKLLLSAYEWAKGAQADALIMEIVAPNNEEPAQRMLEKVGFRRMGVVMEKDLTDVRSPRE